MAQDTYDRLPDDVHSQADGRVLTIEIARRRLATLGVYIRSGLVLLATTLGIAFVIAIDIEVSGQIGRFFFEPMPGAPDTGLFGWKTVLAATLLSALVLHLAAHGKTQSPVMHVIGQWAPRFALAYIVGASLLLAATMTGAIAPEAVSGWRESEDPLVSRLINEFSAGLLSPLAKLAFGLGFGTRCPS